MIRDGREQEIRSFDLVVGDVAVIESGDILPADGILIDGSTLRYTLATMLQLHGQICDELTVTS